jgi:hypothetical protein
MAFESSNQTSVDNTHKGPADRQEPIRQLNLLHLSGKQTQDFPNSQNQTSNADQFLPHLKLQNPGVDSTQSESGAQPLASHLHEIKTALNRSFPDLDPAMSKELYRAIEGPIALAEFEKALAKQGPEFKKWLESQAETRSAPNGASDKGSNEAGAETSAASKPAGADTTGDTKPNTGNAADSTKRDSEANDAKPPKDATIEAMVNPDSPQGTDLMVASVLNSADGKISAQGFSQFEKIAAADTKSMGTYPNDQVLLAAALNQFQQQGGSSGDASTLQNLINAATGGGASIEGTGNNKSGQDWLTPPPIAPADNDSKIPSATTTGDSPTIPATALAGEGSGIPAATITGDSSATPHAAVTGEGSTTSQATTGDVSATSHAATTGDGSAAPAAAVSGEGSIAPPTPGESGSTPPAVTGGWSVNFADESAAQVQQQLNSIFPVQWGNVQAQNGDVTVSSPPGKANTAVSGFMQKDSSSADDQGYGIYTMTAAMTSAGGNGGTQDGAGSGGYIDLWPANNIWPGTTPMTGQELDLAEVWGNGNGGQPIATQHWPGADGSNQFDSHDISGVDVTKPNTYTLDWEPGSITESVNGNLVYSSKTNVSPDAANGGGNASFGVGAEPSEPNGGAGSTVTVYNASYTPSSAST